MCECRWTTGQAVDGLEAVEYSAVCSVEVDSSFLMKVTFQAQGSRKNRERSVLPTPCGEALPYALPLCVYLILSASPSPPFPSFQSIRTRTLPYSLTEWPLLLLLPLPLLQAVMLRLRLRLLPLPLPPSSLPLHRRPLRLLLSLQRPLHPQLPPPHPLSSDRQAQGMAQSSLASLLHLPRLILLLTRTMRPSTCTGFLLMVSLPSFSVKWRPC